MAAKKTKRVSKRVKTLPAKRLTARQAKGVKGGTINKGKDITYRSATSG